jgi:hypothetical protein
MSDVRRESGESAAADLKSRVERELRRLRVREGLTNERVRSVAPTLQELAAADAARRRQPISPSLPAATVALVISGLEFLADQGQTSLLKLGALRAAYGIAVPQRATVDDRRRDYSEQLREGGNYPRANDTLQTWENEIIPGLADVLLASTGSVPIIPQAFTPPLRTEHSVFTDGTHIFTATGTVQEVYVVREVQALRDGLDTVQVSYNYYDDPRPGVLEIIPYTDCQLVATRHTPAGELHADLELPVPLRVGQVQRLSYKILVSTDKRCRNILRRTPRTDGGQTVIRAQFHPNYIPKRAWTFAEATEREIPWDPVTDSMLEISRLGYAEVLFNDMRRGLTYGIVWEWM